MRGLRHLAALSLLVTGAVAIQCAAPALSHDPYSEWRTRNGSSCCNDKDCAPATAWTDLEGRWWVRQQGRTLFVPPSAILPLKSPDGRSHACVTGGEVICFVPGEIRS